MQSEKEIIRTIENMRSDQLQKRKYRHLDLLMELRMQTNLLVDIRKLLRK